MTQIGTTSGANIIPRGLDHIVHAVHDLDAAGDAYARLGFTVGARNRHPWGTHNRIVQFPGVFIELLSVGEPERIPPARPRMRSEEHTSELQSRSDLVCRL